MRDHSRHRNDHFVVASFNLWRGGEAAESDAEVSRAATLAALRATDADVIGLQETNPRTAQYADDLSVHYVDQGSAAIITGFDVAMTADRLGVTIQLPSGRLAHVFNVHLNPKPYQPYQLAGIPYENGRFIATAAEAIDEARKARGAEAARLIAALRPVLASGDPVFVTGDFNEPSHLDWTARAAAASRCPLAVAWPVSSALTTLGLRDAFRHVYPDEIERPGYTWTSRPAPREVYDRIDYIYYAGTGVVPVDAAIVGESPAHADVVVTSWPSDHRALVVGFDGLR
jgi:exodeoxyribonuclease-3